MRVGVLPLNRYRKLPNSVFSQLDHLTDVVSWLEFLTAESYLADVLNKHHGMGAGAARTRARTIIPHVRLAIGFVAQCLEGPKHLSFLPAYYAVLNLMKVYVLTGPRHADLPRHRLHGMSFDPLKASHSILTETVSIKPTGTLPLFYETITGAKIQRSRIVRMGDVYPFISDIEAEYQMAVGRANRLGIVAIGSEVNGGVLRAHARFEGDTKPRSATEVQVLLGGTKSATDDRLYLGRPAPLDGRAPEDVLAEQVRWYLLYSPAPEAVRTPLCSRQLLLPEELPIALLFFHMSSVVRYKPEFFEKLQESKYWPILTVARRHALLKFLLLFWSHMHKQVTVFGSP